MECDRTRKLMALAIGGDVSSATRVSVDTHVAGCPECRAEYENYRTASDALTSVREAPEPPGGWPGIWAGIAEHVESGGGVRPGAEPARVVVPPSWTRRRPLLRLAAVLLVGFTVGFTAYHVGYHASGVPFSVAPAEFHQPVTTADPLMPASPVVRVTPVDSGSYWQERWGTQLGLHPRAEMGWTVRAVDPGGAAEAAGLRVDDALLGVDDVELPRSLEAMEGVMRGLSGSLELRLRVRRGEDAREFILKPR